MDTPHPHICTSPPQTYVHLSTHRHRQTDRRGGEEPVKRMTLRLSFPDTIIEIISLILAEEFVSDSYKIE